MHFSLRDDNLVVRAQGNEGDGVLELIPSQKLREDLPPALVDGHLHWLNLSTKVIEICPLEQLREQSLENWRIDCASGRYRMYRSCETLVEIRSPTWAMVSECFKCFPVNKVSNKAFWIHRYSDDKDDEDLQIQSRNLLITTSPVDSIQSASMQRLSVGVPRYGLSFFVNEGGELESRDFKDMVYDEDQCIGALFGLENLLVLRPKAHIAGTIVPDALIPKRVLIPNGLPKSHSKNQVRIEIDNSSRRHDEPLYYTYAVDTELGCLIGNGSLASTRYLAYLHALTSCYRPDPLTGKTGAQAALGLLQSAGCRSIMKLKALEEGNYWTSTQHPQINAAYKEILKRYYFAPNWHLRALLSDNMSEFFAARLAAYLFPLNAAGPTSLENYDESKYLTTHIPAELGLATLPHSMLSFKHCLPLKQIALDQLLCNRPAPELPARSTLLRDSHNTSSDDIPILDQLFSSLRVDSSFQQGYLAHLDTSARSIHAVSRMTHKVASENCIEGLEKHYVQCRGNYLKSLDILKKSLGPTTDPHEQAVNQFGQWPPITADSLLRYLASTSPIDIPSRWKKCLISLALLLLELQRARRLLRFSLDGLEEDFSKELENEGCDGWDAEEYPDWLLIQVIFFHPNACRH